MNSRFNLSRHYHDAIRVAFGPWAIRPWVMGILLAILFNYSAIEILRIEQGQTVTGLLWLSQAPNALYLGMLYTLPALAWNLFIARIFKMAPNRVTYLVGVVLLAVVGTLGRAFLMPWWEYNYLDSPSQVIALAARVVAGELILFSLLGLNDLRLKQQIARTETALADVEEQRRVIISSEENLRSSIATYLHDNVQASLVALAMQLTMVAKNTDEQTAAQISSIVNELEEVRSTEVRKASHLLSPDISTLGLGAAIKELARTYEPWMLTTVDVNEPWQVNDQAPARRDLVVLGAYRMIEQSLLNAAIHGRSRRVEVNVVMDEHQLLLDVIDDGHGFGQGGYTPGTGAKVINAWVQSLGGTWSIESNTDFGVHVRAWLPFGV